MRKLKNQLTPMCYLPSGKLVCYSSGLLIVYESGKIIRKLHLPLSLKEKYFGWSKWLYRLFRMGIRASEAIDESHIVYSVGNYIYEVDLSTGDVSEGFFCGEGIRPLIITTVKNNIEFDDGLYFGGYLGNDSKNPVHIYKRIGIDNWKAVYTFPQGTINHVHALVNDSYRNCLWAFTGDFGDSSAIWKITNNFKQVDRIFYNDQKYRACVIFALPEGLLYATDGPFVENHIYLLNLSTYVLNDIMPISGSCIYGCKWKDNFVFSSTVEGDGRNMSKLEWLFTRKRGSGIVDNYVHLYSGNIKDGFKELYKERKDKMPFYTFQFGVFKFPYGENNSDKLFFQPIATSENDLCLLEISEKNNN